MAVDCLCQLRRSQAKTLCTIKVCSHYPPSPSKVHMAFLHYTSLCEGATFDNCHTLSNSGLTAELEAHDTVMGDRRSAAFGDLKKSVEHRHGLYSCWIGEGLHQTLTHTVTPSCLTYWNQMNPIMQLCSVLVLFWQISCFIVVRTLVLIFFFFFKGALDDLGLIPNLCKS